MTGKPKPSPLEAFELNMGDAERLVLLAEALTNQRTYRMRMELRAKLGDALKIPRKEHNSLDCVESNDVFVVLKPHGRLDRQAFDQHDPLLRQAVVAACAALETYLADRAIGRVRQLVSSRQPLPPKLAEIAMGVGQWHEIESRYQRRRRGITEVVLAPFLRRAASTSSGQVGALLKMVGIEKGMSKIDAVRKKPGGLTERELDKLTDRRNRIAHSGDRRGHGRASITAGEVQEMLDSVRSVVSALEVVFDG